MEASNLSSNSEIRNAGARTPRDSASSARQAGLSLGVALLAQLELETGVDLPDFVKQEFDAFLQCGILAHRDLAKA